MLCPWCCGLFAILYALGIPVKTSQDIEKYRRICVEQKLVHRRTKKWTWYESVIATHFGPYEHQSFLQALEQGD